MKSVPCIFLCFAIQIFAQEIASKNTISFEDAAPASKVSTMIGLFNATFSWKIGNIKLFDFGTHKLVNHLSGPTLTTFDRKNNNKIYTTQFDIVPEWEYNFRNYGTDNYDIKHYKVTGKFNIPPAKTEFVYVINGTTFEGQIITVAHLKNAETFKVIVKAFYYTTDNSNKLTAPSPIFENEPNTLGKDLLNLFKNDSDSQFTIICDGEVVTVYKQIMQARSSFFKQALSDVKDKIIIDGCQPKIFNKIVEFCNTDAIKSFEEDETNIFRMANAYEIPSLMAYSSKEIAANANFKNAIIRYKLAEAKNYEPLKKWLFNYIVRNFVEISKTEAFKSLDAELHKSILQELLQQKKIV